MGHRWVFASPPPWNLTNALLDLLCLFPERVRSKSDRRPGVLAGPSGPRWVADLSKPVGFAACSRPVSAPKPPSAIVMSPMSDGPGCRLPERRPLVFRQSVKLRCASTAWSKIHADEARPDEVCGGSRISIKFFYECDTAALYVATGVKGGVLSGLLCTA